MKPFGHDLSSAKALNAEILKALKEDQIYRIVISLGKETVQNIMALRFANGMFEPLWNRQHIDHIQITAGGEQLESSAGANSMRTQVHCATWCPTRVPAVGNDAMEPPISFDAHAVRAKKAEVIEAIRPFGPARVLKTWCAASTTPAPFWQAGASIFVGTQRRP